MALRQRLQLGLEPGLALTDDGDLPALRDDFFSSGDRTVFRPLVESLLRRDDYMLLADYQAYVDCQDRVSTAYADRASWTRMSILNSARVGRFSSDRSIRDYCRDIWHVQPMTIPGALP